MTEITDESLAKALGKWYVKRWKTGPVRGLFLTPPDYNLPWEEWDGVEDVVIAADWDRELPLWSESFDACLRDIVPVLRARGWELSMWTNYRTGLWGVAFLSTKFLVQNPKAENVSLPAAFCEAALAALEASK